MSDNSEKITLKEAIIYLLEPKDLNHLDSILNDQFKPIHSAYNKLFKGCFVMKDGEYMSKNDPYEKFGFDWNNPNTRTKEDYVINAIKKYTISELYTCTTTEYIKYILDDDFYIRSKKIDGERYFPIVFQK